MSEVIKKENNVAAVMEYLDYAPPCDVIENQSEIAIVLDVPGVSSEQLAVNVENRILKLEADTSLVRNNKQVRYVRSFQISNEIANDKISASVKDGILKVVLPKADTAKVRKIKVTTEA